MSGKFTSRLGGLFKKKGAEELTDVEPSADAAAIARGFDEDLLATIPKEDGPAFEQGVTLEPPSTDYPSAAVTTEEAPPPDDTDKRSGEDTGGAVPQEKKAGGAFQRLKQTVFSEKQVKLSALPIRVLMGYLPEVSARDAREYAQGLASKHFEQLGLAFYGAFPYGTGYVFEVHEGGPGKAYAPEIIDYFEELGPFQVGEEHKLFVETATRTVEIRRQRDGLVVLILPESVRVVTSDALEPAKALTPVMDRRDKVLYVGSVIFATGFVAALTSGMLFRAQPYEEVADPPPTSVSISHLPIGQWKRVVATPPGVYVSALKFADGKWLEPDIQQAEVVPAPGGPGAVPDVVPPAGATSLPPGVPPPPVPVTENQGKDDDA